MFPFLFPTFNEKYTIIIDKDKGKKILYVLHVYIGTSYRKCNLPWGISADEQRSSQDCVSRLSNLLQLFVHVWKLSIACPLLK